MPRAALLPVLALLFWPLAPPLQAQEGPPAVPPANARFASDPIGARSDAVQFRSDGIQFRSETVQFRTEPLARPTSENRRELVFELGADVLFDFDRAELRPEADPVLRALLDQVKAKLRKPRFLVEGHTDARGEEAYNQKLSERRAASVRDWLVGKGGVEPRAIATSGWGETRPVAPNTKPDGSDDPLGRQRNRRVVVTVRAGG
ncbi:MAG: OmpA family protein [Geminicoccaceae bacterium]|nr:OmpA family protein [Geminicoccaceae bacterium]